MVINASENDNDGCDMVMTEEVTVIMAAERMMETIMFVIIRMLMR